MGPTKCDILSSPEGLTPKPLEPPVSESHRQKPPLSLVWPEYDYEEYCNAPKCLMIDLISERKVIPKIKIFTLYYVSPYVANWRVSKCQ